LLNILLCLATVFLTARHQLLLEVSVIVFVRRASRATSTASIHQPLTGRLTKVGQQVGVLQWQFLLNI
jgi:hypothetical protein